MPTKPKPEDSDAPKGPGAESDANPEQGADPVDAAEDKKGRTPLSMARVACPNSRIVEVMERHLEENEKEVASR